MAAKTMRMKHIKILVWAMTALFLSCHIDLRQVPQSELSKSRTASNSKIVVIKFIAKGSNEFLFEEYHKRSYLSHLRKNIPDVAFVDFNEYSSMNISNPVLVEVQMSSEIHHKINWYVSWPATYPFSPLFWPFQFRYLKYDIVFDHHLFERNFKIKTKISSNTSGIIAMYFYGFLRTGKFEMALKSKYNEAYLKSIESMRILIQNQN